MPKEIVITINGIAAGRVVGGADIAGIAPLLAAEPEVFVVYDENASWVAAEVIAAAPGVRGSIAIEATEEEKSMETVLLITRSLLEAGASRKALVLAIGGACVLVGGALGKKGVKGKIIGAFGNVYGITGFMSDILSYCRLFGLGLATGVVGMVVNLIAGILRDLIPVAGYLLYVVILVVGHVFNIAINTLGAYVYNSRLQYVEFFSRFYTGGGHIFKPMGSSPKYIHLGNKGGKNL